MVVVMMLWPGLGLADDIADRDRPDRQQLNRLETEQRLREKQRQLDRLEALDEGKDESPRKQDQVPAIRPGEGRPDRRCTDDDVAGHGNNGPGERIPCIDSGTQP